MYFIFNISIHHLPSTIPRSLFYSHLHLQHLQCWDSPWSATLLADRTSSNVKKSKNSRMREEHPWGYVSDGKEKRRVHVSLSLSQPLGGLISSTRSHHNNYFIKHQPSSLLNHFLGTTHLSTSRARTLYHLVLKVQY